MKKFLKVFLLIIITLILVFAVNAWANSKIWVSEIEVVSARLPENFDDFTIMQVSDIHSIRSEEQSEAIIEKLQTYQPDIIVLSGDLVDADYYASDLARIEELGDEAFDAEGNALIPDQMTLDCVEEMLEIATVYFTYGNHEMILLDDPTGNPFLVALIEMGVIVLNNDATTIEIDSEMINIVGIQDPATIYKDDMFSTLSGTSWDKEPILIDYCVSLIDPDLYTIAISHRPEYIDIYGEYPLDLVLAGHAHGGQVRLPIIGGLYAPGQGFFPEYTSGSYATTTGEMIVSRGIGNSEIIPRIFNPPELVFITLKCE